MRSGSNGFDSTPAAPSASNRATSTGSADAVTITTGRIAVRGSARNAARTCIPSITGISTSSSTASRSSDQQSSRAREPVVAVRTSQPQPETRLNANTSTVSG